MNENMAKKLVISAVTAAILLAPAFASASMLAQRTWRSPQWVGDSVGDTSPDCPKVYLYNDTAHTLDTVCVE